MNKILQLTDKGFNKVMDMPRWRRWPTAFALSFLAHVLLAIILFSPFVMFGSMHPGTAFLSAVAGAIGTGLACATLMTIHN